MLLKVSYGTRVNANAAFFPAREKYVRVRTHTDFNINTGMHMNAQIQCEQSLLLSSWTTHKGKHRILLYKLLVFYILMGKVILLFY